MTVLYIQVFHNNPGIRIIFTTCVSHGYPDNVYYPGISWVSGYLGISDTRYRSIALVRRTLFEPKFAKQENSTEEKTETTSNYLLEEQPF